MIFENFPKNPEKCLKVTHFWEFGCTQNASLLRMTVYDETEVCFSMTVGGG